MRENIIHQSCCLALEIPDIRKIYYSIYSFNGTLDMHKILKGTGLGGHTLDILFGRPMSSWPYSPFNETLVVEPDYVYVGVRVVSCAFGNFYQTR